MEFSYTVADETLAICETQVEDLTEDLARQCEQRIGILTQKAAEEAMRILAVDGNLDTAQLVSDAQMPPKKKA